MKKFSIALMALGLLAMGSCVDDNESASVTAVRTAKAEQLKAAAALDNANAEAALILANAEAAMKNAEAAYKNALAASEQQSIEEAKARFAAELELIQLRAQLEVENLKNQISALQIQNANAEIKNLYDQYASEVATLAGLNTQLASAKTRLVSAENSLTSAEAANKQTILNLQRNIANNEAKLAIYNDPDFQGLDQQELLEQAQAKQNEYDKAVKEFSANQLCSDLLDASKTTYAAYETYQTFNNSTDGTITVLQNFYTQAGAGGVLNYVSSTSTYIGFEVYTYVGYDLGTDGNYYGAAVRQNVSLNVWSKSKADKYYAAYADNAISRLGSEDDDATAVDPNTGYLTIYAMLAQRNDILKGYQKDLKAAQDALAEANEMPEKTDEEKAAKKAAIEAANADIQTANDNIANQQVAIDYFKQTTLALAIKNVANAEKVQADYAAAVKAFDIDAYNEAATALVEDFNAQEEAYTAWSEARASISDIQAEAQVLRNMAYSNATDIQAEINSLEQQIANDQARIKTTEANLSSYEVAIANAQAQIDSLETQIAAMEKVVANTKAALEAAINAQ